MKIKVNLPNSTYNRMIKYNRKLRRALINWRINSNFFKIAVWGSDSCVSTVLKYPKKVFAASVNIFHVYLSGLQKNAKKS